MALQKFSISESGFVSLWDDGTTRCRSFEKKQQQKKHNRGLTVAKPNLVHTFIVPSHEI